MTLVLFVLFIVFPVVELTVIIMVGGQIGPLPTIALLFLVGAVGAWLAKREGVNVLERLNSALNRGEVPTNELIDGGLILLAGLLMLAPGFVSDILGILLLLPPVRALFRAGLHRRFRTRIERATAFGGSAGFATGFGRAGGSDSPMGASFGGFRARRFGADVLDTTATEAPRSGPSPSGPPHPELGRHG